MSKFFKRSFLAYPIFPYFLVGIFATVLACEYDSLRQYWQIFAWGCVGFVIVDFTISLFLYCGFSFTCIRIVQRFVRIFAFMLFCICLFFLRVDENKYPDFPPTETELSGEILEYSCSAKGSAYGVLKINESKLEFLKDNEVWFTFANHKRGQQYILPVLKRGDIVKVFCVIRSIKENPPSTWGYVKDKNAQRSFDKYLLSRFIYFKMFANVGDVSVIDVAKSSSFGENIAKFVKGKLSKTCFFNAENLAYTGALKAMILGDKSNLTSEQKQIFKNTGTMHVFAVSGLHVGIIALLLFYICSVACVPMYLRSFIVVPLLFLYVLACGLPASAVRAFIMVATFVLALSFSRGSRPINALMVSAVIAILVSPKVIFSAGFQLSYAVVGSLLLYSSVFVKLQQNFSARIYDVKFAKFFNLLFKFFVGGLCVSIGACCVALPITAYWFGSFSISGIFVSPIFVLLASVAVATGIIGAILPSVVGGIFNDIAILSVKYMSLLAEFVSDNFPMLWHVDINNGYFVCIIVGGILLLASFVENVNVLLRFILVPLVSGLIMFFIWIL